MTADSTRAQLVYSTLLENVTDRSRLGEPTLIDLLEHVSIHPDAGREAFRIIRDMVRITGGILLDVLGHDKAADYLSDLLVLVETACILDSVETDQATQPEDER